MHRQGGIKYIESQEDYVEWYVIHICVNAIFHINAKDLSKAPRNLA